MHVQWFAHLPGVQLATRRSLEVLEGRFANLTFEEWCELDPSFPYSRDKYVASRPAFYVGSAELEGELKDILTQVSARIHRLYTAFLLDSRVPLLPEPQLSVHYVRVNLQAGVATYRLVGPFEREWILYGNQIVYPFDAAAIEALESVYHMLPEKGENGLLQGVAAGLETLVRTARPDIWWDQRVVHHINDFIHCTQAIQNIVVSDQIEEDHRIPRVFGEHAAVLVSKSRDTLNDLAASYAGLYRLRNNLMYGQMAMSDLSESDQQVLRLGRILLREVLIKVLVLNRYARNGQSDGQVTIPAMLHHAFEQNDYYQDIQQKLGEVEALI